MPQRPGPGFVNLAHTINRVTADRQLTMELCDSNNSPLAHMDMTKKEALMFINNLIEAVESIWPGTKLKEGL